MKTAKKKVWALPGYIGYGDEAGEYFAEVKRLADNEKKTLSDFVLDAVEFYIKSKAAKTFNKPTVPAIKSTLPAKAPQSSGRAIDYSETEDPVPPKIDAASIPSSRPTN